VANQHDEEVVLLVDIRALRAQAKIAVIEAARIIGVGKSTLERVETGRMPSLSVALKIAASYGIPVEQIWGIPEEKG
jgi:DNA-binding XRE family transcriptional regulator